MAGLKPKSAPLHRLTTLLDLVAEAPKGLTTAEIATKASLPIATAHRIVSALLAEGYLERSGRGEACLIGARIKRLSMHGALGKRTSDAIRPKLQVLADTVDAVSFLIRRIDQHVDTVAQALPSRTNSTIVLPGVDIPLHASSSGKVMLAWLSTTERRSLLPQPLIPYRPATITVPEQLEAHLRNVRRKGYATCRDEFDRGVFSLSVPIRTAKGAVEFAMGVVGFEHSLLSSWPEKSLAKLVVSAGKDIERALVGSRRTLSGLKAS